MSGAQVNNMEPSDSDGEETLTHFMNYKASYAIGALFGFMLHRYVGSRVFPVQKLQDSERIFWGNILLLVQLLGIAFVFIGSSAYSGPMVPDLIFETLALATIGFVTFAGVDGHIDLGFMQCDTHPSIIAFGFYFHSIWNMLHILSIIPSFAPIFCVRACLCFDLYVGYELFIKSYTVDCTADYQRLKS